MRYSVQVSNHTELTHFSRPTRKAESHGVRGKIRSGYVGGDISTRGCRGGMQATNGDSEAPNESGVINVKQIPYARNLPFVGRV